MKPYKCFSALFLLCAFFLMACGSTGSGEPTQEEDPDAGSATPSLQPGERSGIQDPRTSAYLEPLYDPQSNSVTLTDLTTNTILASYQFDAEQFVRSIETVNDGIVILSTAETEDMAEASSDQDMVWIRGGNGDETITISRFDQTLNLQDRFCLKDAGLPDDLLSYPLAISRNGRSLTWVQEDGIYRYAMETGELKQTPIKVSATVYFDQIRYGEDGKKLFYFGGSGQEDVTFYGFLDVETGEGTLFQAKDFDPSSITVTRDYAVVNAAVPPGALRGNGRVLLIDSVKKTGNEITLNSPSENDLAVVTSDGKTLVTCAATDGKDGVLHCYDVANGNLKWEQPYSCEQENKPYLLLVQGQTAQAVLYTEHGFALSSPLDLP